jgi:uncharacterized protein YwqG
MTGVSDIKGMTEAQLAEAYAENVQVCEATEHVGKHNRIFGRRREIIDELKARGEIRPALERLLNHPDAQVRSSAQWELHWLNHPTPQAPPHRPLPTETQWQCDNPPPLGMTPAVVARRLQNVVPEASDRLMDLALPAIGLWPQRPRADSPATASRLGGAPLAPPDWQWPIVDDEPLLFVGQINCAELHGLPGAELLPSSGLLAFFGDHDGLMACRIEARDIAIYHWTDIDSLVAATAPITPSIVFPMCTLATRPVIDLPDPHSCAVQNLSLNEEQVSRYAIEWKALRRHRIPDGLDYYCGFSKLLGWPAQVQAEDPTAFCEHGRLLLQVDDYCNGEDHHSWGGAGGSIYFILSEDDLQAQNFAACAFDIQFT